MGVRRIGSRGCEVYMKSDRLTTDHIYSGRRHCPPEWGAVGHRVDRWSTFNPSTTTLVAYTILFFSQCTAACCHTPLSDSPLSSQPSKWWVETIAVM